MNSRFMKTFQCVQQRIGFWLDDETHSKARLGMPICKLASDYHCAAFRALLGVFILISAVVLMLVAYRDDGDCKHDSSYGCGGSAVLVQQISTCVSEVHNEIYIAQQIQQIAHRIHRKRYATSLQNHVTSVLNNLHEAGWQLHHADYADLSSRVWVMVVSKTECQAVQIIVCRACRSDVAADLSVESAPSIFDDDRAHMRADLFERNTQVQQQMESALSHSDYTSDGCRYREEMCEETIYELCPEKMDYSQLDLLK